MPDLHDLPADVQLQIYDLFLSLRTYQRQHRLDTICTAIKEGIDGKDLYDYKYRLIISGIDEINVDDDEELRNSLPAVIRTGYKLINLVWGEEMDWGSAMLTRCSMSLDDDEADVEVLRLYLRNDAFSWGGLYDIHTFKCLTCIQCGKP